MKLIATIAGGVLLGVLIWQGLVYTDRLEKSTIASLSQDQWDNANFCGHYGLDCLGGR